VYRAIAKKVKKLTAQTMTTHKEEDLLELLEKKGL
jgi:hypothetical protein